MKRILLVAAVCAALSIQAAAQQDSSRVTLPPGAVVGGMETGRPEKAGISGPSIIEDGFGDKWMSITDDGVTIAVRASTLREYGKYCKIELYILNESSGMVNFHFTEAGVSSPESRAVRPFTENQFLRRTRNRQGWATFGQEFALAIGTMVLDAVFNGTYDNDPDRWTFGRDVAHAVGSEILYDASSVGAVLIAENAGRKFDRIIEENLGYLRDYSLEPGRSMAGHMMAKDVPAAKHLVVDVPLDTRVYRFILQLR